MSSDRLRAASIASDINLDAEEIAARKSFLEFGSGDVELLKGIHDRLETEKDRFTQTFYEHLLQFEPLRTLVGDETGLARLRKVQSAYFSSLTAGDYGREYVLGRLDVGAVHQRVGLDPKWYIGAYRKYLSVLLPVIAQVSDRDCDRCNTAVDAMLKVILFDMGLALDTYFHHERQEVAHSRSHAEQVLRSIVDGTSTATGPNFLKALAKHLAAALGARHAMLGICDGPDRVNTLAMWSGDGFAPNFSYELAGTPCRNVVNKSMCIYTRGVAKLFPHDLLLADMKVESYIGTPIFDSHGETIGILVVMDDKETQPSEEILSILRVFAARAGAELERMKAEAEVNRLNQSLEQRVHDRTAELEAFGYSLSHDLRAPLRSIIGFGEALDEDHAAALAPEGREYLRRLIAAGQRMNEMIEDMLSLFHLGRQEPVWRHLDLGEIAEEVFITLAAAHPERRLHWTATRPLPTRGDPGLLRAALENLIGNAWKYTARQDDARVEFGAENSAEGQSIYFVRDNGAGFDMEHSARLFKPFQRLHREADFPGSGVGLATVKRIITLHGGWISAQAEPGRGATFRFTLGANQSYATPGSG